MAEQALYSTSVELSKDGYKVKVFGTNFWPKSIEDINLFIDEFDEPEHTSWKYLEKTPITVKMYKMIYNDKIVFMMKLSTGGKNGECECGSGLCNCDWKYIAHKDYENDKVHPKFTCPLIRSAEDIVILSDGPVNSYIS